MESFICSTCDPCSIQPESILFGENVLYEENNQQQEPLDENNKVTVITDDEEEIQYEQVKVKSQKSIINDKYLFLNDQKWVQKGERYTAGNQIFFT